MIGTIISMKVLGKKSWWQSILFWIVYFVAMVIITSISISALYLSGGLTGIDNPEEVMALTSGVVVLFLLMIVMSFVIFYSLARKWYKLKPFDVLKVYAVAIFIDIIISAILNTIIGGIGLYPGGVIG